MRYRNSEKRRPFVPDENNEEEAQVSTENNALAPQLVSPGFVTPRAAQVVKGLPEGDEWTYELKFDGYRALVIKDRERVEIRSRKDKDLTRMYPRLAASGMKLKADQAVVDGEIVALDVQGRPSFQRCSIAGLTARIRPPCRPSNFCTWTALI